MNTPTIACLLSKVRGKVSMNDRFATSSSSSETASSRPVTERSVVGAPSYFIGMMVYQQQGTAGNLPLAAAFSVVPILLIGAYLSLARRLGAFDAL